VFAVHIIGFNTHSFYLWYLLSKLRNLLTQCDFKLAGPVLTQVTLALIFQDRLCERLLENRIPVGNMPIGGCRERKLVYNLS
jgi:hypothetical protein